MILKIWLALSSTIYSQVAFFLLQITPPSKPMKRHSNKTSNQISRLFKSYTTQIAGLRQTKHYVKNLQLLFTKLLSFSKSTPEFNFLQFLRNSNETFVLTKILHLGNWVFTFQNGCNKCTVVIELEVVQLWSKIILTSCGL